jgi:hypothetical protein
MSPESETNIFLGPPSPSKLDKEPSLDDELEIKSLRRMSHDVSDCIVFFINETTLGQSPQIEIKVAGRIGINAIVDSGSEVNILSEEVYEKLRKEGVDIPVLPVENVVLVTAFGKRSKRIRHQALIEFTVGSDVFESVFMITAQLNNEAIIGCQFLKEYGVSINFDRGTLSYVRGGVLREQEFATKARLQNVICDDRSGTRESFLQNNPSTGQRPQPLSADCTTTIPTRTVPSHSRPLQQVSLQKESQGQAVP